MVTPCTGPSHPALSSMVGQNTSPADATTERGCLGWHGLFSSRIYKIRGHGGLYEVRESGPLPCREGEKSGIESHHLGIEDPFGSEDSGAMLRNLNQVVHEQGCPTSDGICGRKLQTLRWHGDTKTTSESALFMLTERTSHGKSEDTQPKRRTHQSPIEVNKKYLIPQSQWALMLKGCCDGSVVSCMYVTMGLEAEGVL